jgi:hypothetical protein
MKKSIFIFFFSLLLTGVGYCQAMVSKILGQQSNSSTWGFGIFSNVDFPLPRDNESVRLEFPSTFYPQRDKSLPNYVGSFSLKTGFKYVFSRDQVGFYVVPSVGYGWVSRNDPHNIFGNEDGNAFAWSFETGYSFGVGRHRNTINLGIVYEDYIGDVNHRVSSIGLGLSFSFHLIRRNGRYG